MPPLLANTRFCAMSLSGKHDPIRFSQPVMAGREWDYLREAVAQGQLSSDGLFTQRCQTWLASALGARHVHLTHSATAALELSAVLTEVGPGDEVIMPSYTFVSCANAIALRRGMPVFVDIRPDTINIDPKQVEQAITERTRAIMAVHYAGVPCDMEPILALAKQHGLIVIEDAAQALMASYRGKPAGTLGHFGIFSFHDTKNVISGEGGAIVVNDARFSDRAEIVWRHGTDRRAFDRGERQIYTWLDLGSSFAPSEIVAAVLLAQLERAEAITRARHVIWSRYHSAFAPLESDGVVRRPVIPEDVTHNAHAYYLLLSDQTARDGFIASMHASGIATPFHFVPLDDSPGGRRYARTHGELPETRSVAQRLVRLPLWSGMEPVQDRVIEVALAALGH
jgi:dTDP-4-amino-4,6-dideoxygalactose transaminase